MRYFIFCIVFIFTACTSRKALQGEDILFPKKGENKLWIINTTAAEKHFCSLITLETIEGKEYLRSFSGIWAKNLPYEFSIHTGTKGVDYRTEFPILFSFDKSDSLFTESFFKLNRNKLVWKGQFTNGNAATFKSNFQNQIPFQISNTFSEPKTLSVNPIQTNDSSTLFIQTINSTSNLLNEKLVWANVMLHSGLQLSVLFTPSDNAFPKALIVRDSTGKTIVPEGIKIQTNKTGIWRSIVSNKTYNLSFSIQIYGVTKELVIIPREQTQEIYAKKSSFWMGAIEVIDPITKNQQGLGNMYIFNP